MPGSPTLSIIIVTYNAGAFVSDCLASIARRSPPFGIEVVLVDNASTDGTIDAIRTGAPGAIVIAQSRNTGFAAATNAGFAASSGEFVLLLNPDTVLHDGSLERLAGFLREHPAAGAVGPRILNPDGTLQRTGMSAPSLWNLVADTLFLDRAFPRSRIFGRHRRLYEDPDASAEVEYLQGSCLLLRRSAIGERVFDESYFLYFEETDLCTRLRETGWKIFYFPGASIVHAVGSGAQHYDRERIVRYHESFVVYLKKHTGAPRRFLFRVVLIARALLRWAILSLGAAVNAARRAELLDRARGYFRAASTLAGVNR
jgi:GT2 family glycosyltransferase